MNSIDVGKRIKYARTLRGYTLDDIANDIGVAKSTIQRYEAGKIHNLKLPVLESIARSLNVNPSWLCGKSLEMNSDHKPNDYSHSPILSDLEIELVSNAKGLSAPGYRKLMEYALFLKSLQDNEDK